MKMRWLRVGGLVLSCVPLAMTSGACTVSAGISAEPVIANCTQDDSLDCSGGGYGYSCTAGSNPEDEDASLSCSVPSPQPDGTDGYCCFTWSYGTSTCTPDDALTAQCPDPDTYGYQCAAGDDPTSLDATLNCSAPTPDGPQDDFCCGYGAAVGGGGGSTCAQDDSVQGCEPPSIGYSCAGADTPDQTDPTLTCSDPVVDPSSGDSLYCCQ